MPRATARQVRERGEARFCSYYGDGTFVPGWRFSASAPAPGDAVQQGHRDAPLSAAFALAISESTMSLGTILLIILILLLIGAIPSWPYSSGWGYGPSGILGVILIVVLILVLLGRI